MDRLRYGSLQVAVGAFVSFVGALILIAPHQFVFFNDAILQNYRIAWGTLMMLSGALLTVFSLIFPQKKLGRLWTLLVAAHLILLALAFMNEGAWLSGLSFALLAAGTLYTSRFYPRSKTEHPVPFGDFAALLFGISTLLVGLAIVLFGLDLSSDPLYHLPDRSLVGIGLIFTFSGSALVLVQVYSLFQGTFLPPLPSIVVWGAHLFVGVSFFVFALLATQPSHIWLAFAYYGLFGVLLIVLPGLAPRLERFQPDKLWIRLALILAAATALPVIFTVMFISEREESAVRAAALARQQTQAVTLAQTIADYINLHRSALISLAQQPGLTHMTPDDLQNRLKIFASAYPEATLFSIYDLNGAPVASSSELALTFPINGSPVFDDLVRFGGPSTDVIYSPAFNRPIFGFGMPIFNEDGLLSGAAILWLTSSRVNDLLLTQNNPSHGMVYLVDERGRAIAHPAPSLVASLENLSETEPVNAMLSDNKDLGSVVYFGNDGEEMVSYARVPGVYWGVLVERPAKAILAEVYTERDLAFGFLLAFLALTVTGGFTLASWLVEPLSSLTYATSALANGYGNVPLPTNGFAEVKQLANVFGEMRKRLVIETTEREKMLNVLHHAKDELEVRVADRTAELQALNEELSQVNIELEKELEERRRVETALRSSESRLRRLVESNMIGVIFSNEDGEVTQANEAFLDLTGYNYEDLWSGRISWQKLTPAEFLGLDEEHLAEIHKRGACPPYEKECIRKDGKHVPILVGIARLDELPTEYIAFVLDLSESKKAEAALHDYAEKLERSNRELQEFAFVASHDLQEPLRKVQAFGDRLKFLAGSKLSVEEEDALDRMQKAAARMRTMVEDLLTLSRVTTRGKPFETTGLQTIAAEVISDLEVQIQHKEGKVEIFDLPTIEADPLQMRQLLQNLIGNALKYHRPDTSPVIRIYATEVPPNGVQDRIAKIYIEDNGIGFDEQYSERIFQPFYRLHGRSEYEGSGMGLAICRKIVNRHGGTITAKSSPGRGSTFIVSLPLKQPQKEAVQPGQSFE